MVDYLGTLTSREQDLLTSFGASGCVLDTSWKDAMNAELEGTTKLTSIDMRFLLDNKGKCAKTVTTRTGFIINAGSIFANVYNGATYVGKTDATIEIVPGLYVLTVKKTGYNDKEVPLEVKSGEIASATITLEKTTVVPGEDEIPVDDTGTSKLSWTGNRKFPSPITLGKDNWFGIEVKNDGTKTWVGYIGVKLTAADGTPWSYTGDNTMATSVAAGVTKYIWCKASVPATLGTGNIAVSILKYTISG